MILTKINYLKSFSIIYLVLFCETIFPPCQLFILHPIALFQFFNLLAMLYFSKRFSF